VTVRRFNDNSLELAVAFARLWSVIGNFLALLLLFGGIWHADLRYVWCAILLSVVNLAVGWFGWLRWGNAAWRSGSWTDAALDDSTLTCGARYGADLTCTQGGSDHSPHWDEVHDPESRRCWS